MTANAIRPGETWLDTDGKPIQAHGGSVFFENETFYFYGENKEKTTPGSGIWHWGVRCYSSKDLYNWKSEGIILPPIENELAHPLHPMRIMDRPHIMRNRQTGKYVMWMKLAGSTEIPADWAVQYMGVAVADAITGPFTLVKTLRPLGMYTGDFDLQKDERDGKGYFIFGRPHTEIIIADLADDYLGLTGYYSSHFPQPGPPLGREAPAYFKVGSRCFMITSGTTGYNPNRAEYAVADLMHGPWRVMGDPCVGDHAGTTFRSQISSVFVHPGKKNLIVAVADRWNAADNSKAGYVWLPIEVKGDALTIRWCDEWRAEDFE